MTEAEIIKAFECCIGDADGKDCFSCPLHDFDDCQNELNLSAFDLINRQKAEIEVRKINMNAFGLGMKREKERADNARAEAIKEFARMLEPKLANNTDISAVGYQSIIAEINNLVKEMVGDTEWK